MNRLKIPIDRFIQPQSENVPLVGTDDLFLDAISATVDYPPLNQFILEGDSISFVFLANLNQLEVSAASLLNCLPDLLTHVEVNIVSGRPMQFSSDEIAEWQRRFSASNLILNFVCHDVSDQSASAIIAISQDGTPLYMNRTMFDSDVVIPVYSSASMRSPQSSVFPQFSTTDNIDRAKSESLSLSQRRGEIRMVEEAIGINCVIVVSTNPGGQIDAVHCGEKNALADRASAATDSNWHVNQQPDAKVVVATVESQNQSWEHIFQAIVTASQASLNNERIIICTDIDELPGAIEHSVLQLQFESDQDAVENVLKNVPANYHLIAGILEEKSVFLQSKLDANDVEELGLGHVENDRQIQRIIDEAESGVYIRDAHLCEIVVTETSK